MIDQSQLHCSKTFVVQSVAIISDAFIIRPSVIVGFPERLDSISIKRQNRESEKAMTDERIWDKKQRDEASVKTFFLVFFIPGDRIGLTPGQALFCFFLLTAAVAVGVTLLCCHVSGKDPVTTFKYMVTRLKFYYYYYMRRAPMGNKYFWSSVTFVLLDNHVSKLLGNSAHRFVTMS